MKDFRYIFDGPYLTCPHCGREGKYRNIYDRATGQPVADGECGACFVCDFDVNAYQYFKEHPEAKTDGIPYIPLPVKPISYIPDNEITSHAITGSLRGKANLIDYLLGMMDEADLMPVLTKYGIGADGYGALMWPQIDTCHQVREIKIQWHNRSNGSRKGGYTYFLHKQLRDKGKIDPNTSHKQCLFGLHLLDKATPDTVACIVESEKTAIICAVALPQFVWLATGGESNFSLIEDAKGVLSRCKAVVVYPDAGSSQKWKQHAGKLGLDNIVFSDFCSGHPHNTDIADLFIYEWMEKSEKIAPVTETKEEQPTQPATKETPSTDCQTAKIVNIRKTPLFPEPYSYNWPYEYGLTDTL